MLCNFIRRTVSTWQLRSNRAVFAKSRQESGFIPIWAKKLLSVHSDDGKKTSLSQEALINININMRWILQPVKISASIFFHGRQFDLQTGRQSAPAGPAALVVVVVRYQMHQTQQSCPVQCVQHIAASSIIKSPHRTNSTPSFSSPTQKWNQTNMTPRSAVLYSPYTQSFILWHSQTALPFLPDCFLIADHPYIKFLPLQLYLIVVIICIHQWKQFWRTEISCCIN